jgi:hypothetical protein
VVRTPASYSRGGRFKSWLRPAVLTEVLMVFLSFQAYARIVPQIRPLRLPSISFSIYYSLIVLSSDAI